MEGKGQKEASAVPAIPLSELNRSQRAEGVSPSKRLPTRQTLASWQSTLKGAVSDSVAGKVAKIGELHDHLQGIVGSLEKRIDAKIEREEQDIVTICKVQLMKQQVELRECRQRLEEQEALLQDDTALQALRREIDHFKLEAMQLAQVAGERKEEIAKLKTTITTLEEDKEYLEKKLKHEKQKSKALRLALHRLNLQVQQSMAVRTSLYETVHHSNPSNRSKDDRNVKLDKGEELQPGNSCAESSGLECPLKRDQKPSFANARKHLRLDKFLEQLRLPEIDKDEALDCCQEFYEAHMLKYEELVRGLQKQIHEQAKISQKLRGAQVDSVAARGELEQLLYDCVLEVRKRTRRAQLVPSPEGGRDDPSILGASANELRRKQWAPLPSDKVRIMEEFVTNEKVLRALFKNVFGTERKLNEKPLPNVEPLSHPRTDTQMPNHSRVSALKRYQNSGQERAVGLKTQNAALAPALPKKKRPSLDLESLPEFCRKMPLNQNRHIDRSFRLSPTSLRKRVPVPPLDPS